MAYEYKTVKIACGGLLGERAAPKKIDKHLNALGAEGWELVALHQERETWALKAYLVYTLKRPRS